MLGLDGEFPAVHPIAKFRHFLGKNCKKVSSKALHRNLGNFKKSDCKKHSIEKSIFLNFVNLSPTFCPRL